MMAKTNVKRISRGVQRVKPSLGGLHGGFKKLPQPGQ